MTEQIQFAPLSDFFLDSRNPRLGRSVRESNLSQDQLLDHMRQWSLEELATSFLESGFWAHEAVLCTTEDINGQERLVVIEGNRRIAALKILHNTISGERESRKWQELIQGVDPPTKLFEKVPYIHFPDRNALDSFLGFRHVTGIKEWAPPEKAQFIAKLIDEKNLSYREVMRKIGSTTPVVERNYIAFCMLKQMENTEDLDFEEVENRFSVLFLSLRSRRVQDFLGIIEKFNIDPKEVMPPVNEDHIQNLREYCKWLFGDAERSPIVRDSRDVDRFARVLTSDKALEYLRNVRRPNLETAYAIAGGDLEELYELLAAATYSLQQALQVIHLHKADDRVRELSGVLFKHVHQIEDTLRITD